jgi:hypothetical protein
VFPLFTTGDLYGGDDSILSATAQPTSPSIYATFSVISLVPYNELPFDDKNYTYVTGAGTMTYTVKGAGNFDTVALGRIKADTATITFKDAVGVVVGTPITRTIDASRDEAGHLEQWHTTEVFYSDSVITNGTVEMTLTGATIELGLMMLGMSVDSGFTNLELLNSFKDFSVYQEDEWGNIDYVPRAKKSVYKGSVDILITNYDRTNRLLISLGGLLVIVDGSDARNATPDSENIFAATQMIGRFFDISQKTLIKEKDMDKIANYTFTLEETV